MPLLAFPPLALLLISLYVGIVSARHSSPAMTTAATRYTFSCVHLGGNGEYMRCVPVPLLTYGRALELLKDDASFRASLSSTIASCPFAGVFFETPKLTLSTAFTTTFEFVLKSAPLLPKRPVDVLSFAKPLAATEELGSSTVAFPNLGHDALLIVPKPLERDVAMYAHLAIFLRRVPTPQMDSFWRVVSEQASTRIRNGEIVWLSTSGMGVSYLHIRLDSVPKYYTFSEYIRGS